MKPTSSPSNMMSPLSTFFITGAKRPYWRRYLLRPRKASTLYWFPSMIHPYKYLSSIERGNLVRSPPTVWEGSCTRHYIGAAHSPFREELMLHATRGVSPHPPSMYGDPIHVLYPHVAFSMVKAPQAFVSSLWVAWSPFPILLAHTTRKFLTLPASFPPRDE